MNATSDPAAANSDGTFDAEQAASLLDQTSEQARRRFQPSPPWLLATRGVMVFLALGAVWFSVRGQHPYHGPTSADIPILIAFIVIGVFLFRIRERFDTIDVSALDRSRGGQG